MEKRGLLGAVAMAAVQNLRTLPATDSAAGATAATGGDTAAAAGRGKPAGRQNRGGGGAAAAAVAEMLDTASGCEDMDEIFKSLSAMLAEAQAESRQVCNVR